ncbi:MAG: hypothetical protein WD156_10690 [Acidimicrobiia bacterium]
MRGCTLHSARTDFFEAVWLLAVGGREDGSDGDAFSYFETLADAGNLLPTEADWMTVAVERLLWVTIPHAIEEAIATVSDALRSPRSVVKQNSPVSRIETVAEVLIDADEDREDVAELTVAFYHGPTAAEQGRFDVHYLILSAIADAYAFEPSTWEEVWDMNLDQTARGMYAALFKYDGDESS